MGQAYMELIENFLSSELDAGFDADGMKALAGMSQDQLELFREQWEAVDRGQHERMVQTDPAEALRMADPAADAKSPEASKPPLRPTSALFTHPYNGLAPVDLNLVKRQALLFSRIALIVPRPPGYFADPKQRIASAVEHIKGMLELKESVNDGSVELLPMFGFYSNEIEGGAGLVRRACQEDVELQKWLAAEQPALADFSKNARPGDPFFDAGIRICSALTYGHTLAATHQFVGGLFKQLVSSGPRVDRSRIAATQYIQQLDLPGFSDLTWADIKSVRDNEDSLATWRADLDVAISGVDPDLPPEKFVERFDSQVQAQLARAALTLDKEIKESSAMTRFRAGGTSLAISAIAAVAHFPFVAGAALWAGVKEVLSNDGPTEAVRFMWEWKGQKSERALRKHYAVFSAR